MTPTRALRREITLAVTLTAVSCNGLLRGCEPEPIIDGPDDTGWTCSTTIDETWPEQGATDSYCRADIEFFLSDPDPRGDPVISLSSQGQEVPGTSWLSEDGETVYFTPDAPLAPATAYSATLSYCHGEPSIDFTTSALCTPLEEDLEGRTYLVNLMAGRVVEPPGIGDVIGDLLGATKVLVEVQRADEDLVFLGAMAESSDETQDLCAPTIPFPPADFSETPYFEIPPMLLELEVDDMAVTLRGFTMAGTFAADGTWFGGAVIGGELDMRDLIAFVPEVETPEEICDLTASFGAGCKECSGDEEPLCLQVLIDRLVGEEVPVDLVEVTDPGANPDCQ